MGGSLGSAPEMVDTPWGPSELLRERRLRPGPGTPPEDVARNQRGRLFGAMVASVAERGYAATRLSDLAELSGVSLNSFYSLFADKEACFAAASEEILAATLGAMTRPAASWEDQVRRDVAAFAELVVAQPAAARMCLIEAQAVGPTALEPLEEAMAKVEAETLEAARTVGYEAEELPAMVSALVGALMEIVRGRLRSGKEAELPGLVADYADLALSYRPPPRPLRLSTRRPTPAPETIEAHDHGERALRSFAVVVAERGYANTTVNQVVKRASMSPTTFYANFRDKEDALMAAIDGAGAQLVAAILPTFRRNRDWPQGVRAAMGALFNFLASRPALARLVIVEVYAAGPGAVGRREEALRPLEVLLAEGRARSPAVPAIAEDVIAGAIVTLAYKQIRDSGPEGLPALAPICTYLALAPFIGAEVACAAANGDGRSRSVNRGVIRGIAVNAPLSQVLEVISKNTAVSAEMIASETGVPAEAVAHYIGELENAGLVEVVEQASKDDGVFEPRYRSNMARLDDAAWHSMPQPQRERISQQIGHLIKGEWDEAVEKGTFDGRVGRHLSRLPFVVDEQGWRELLEISDSTLDAALEVQATSAERLKKGAEEGVEGRMMQLLFEMPKRDQTED
jgi:AcrR family transcriptional regulator